MARFRSTSHRYWPHASTLIIGALSLATVLVVVVGLSP
jgi:hypothetical protein